MKKKILTVILSLLIAVLFVGCDGYTPPGSGSDKKPSPGSDGSSYGARDYVVTLVCDGEPYSPEIAISARWSGEGRIYSAKFDENGVAVMSGLDGEYHVTLSAVPEGYTYDCNGHIADINNRQIEVELLKIIPTTGLGDGLYVNTGCISLSKLGTYRTTLTSASQTVYYEYRPTAQGSYSITSWVDITENEVNPIMDYHRGTIGRKDPDPTEVHDDGGMSSTYTKNFKFILNLTKDEVNNVWTFGVHAKLVPGREFPVTVDFTIKFEGNYKRDEEQFAPVQASGNLQNIRPAGTFRYNYMDTSGRLLDATRFALDPDDGYYHLIEDPSKILFAKISKDCEVFAPTESQMGFLDVLIYGYLYFYGKSYMSFIDAYAEYCNSDGAHPVTEELKVFLQEYATHGLLFMDGNGPAETKTKLKSAEDDQWLFACGYYV